MKKEEKPFRIISSSLFELYHLILVAGAHLGFIYLLDFFRELLYPRHSGDFFFVMIFPGMLYGVLRLLARNVRPGRVAWNLVVLLILCIPLVKGEYIPMLDVTAGLMGYSLFCFTLGWIMMLWMASSRKLRISRLRKMRQEHPACVTRLNDPIVQTPLAQVHREDETPDLTAKQSRLNQPMKSASYLVDRLKFMQSGLRLKKRTPAFRFLYMLYHLLLVGACNYGFLVLARSMWLDGGRTRMALGLIVLVYPAALCGIVTLLAWELSALRTFLSCAATSAILGFLLYATHPVVLMAFPILCFGYGYLFTLKKEKKWPKVAAQSGRNPLVLDPAIDMRRQADRQIERKYRSKRQNTGWYKHIWFSR